MFRLEYNIFFKTSGFFWILCAMQKLKCHRTNTSLIGRYLSICNNYFRITRRMDMSTYIKKPANKKHVVFTSL